MIKAARTDTPPGSVIRIILQGAFLLLILFISLYCLKNAAIKQLEATRSDYLDITSSWLTDPDVLAEMAEREYLTGAPLKARALYIRALDSFVLHFPSWLGLAEVLNDQQKTNQAAAVLQTLENFTVEKPVYLWRMTQLARKLHQDKILLSTLKLLLAKDAQQKSKIFNIAGSYWQDPQYLLQNFNSRYYPEILDYFIREKKPAAVRDVWAAMKTAGPPPARSVIAYTSFLLHNNNFDHAANTWRNTLQQKGNLLYNGSFNEPILNTSFGWQATDTKSVSLQYDETGGGLTIQFAGTENTAFMLSQIVPLYPGDHLFRGFFETTALTSQERPFWLISGYNCPGLYIEDTMLPPSEYKTEFVIPFHLPEDCKAVKIDLIRKKANPFDSLISGSVTLTDLQIQRQSPLPANQAEEKIISGSTPPDTTVQHPQSAVTKTAPPIEPLVAETNPAIQADTQPEEHQTAETKPVSKKEAPKVTIISQNHPATKEAAADVFKPQDAHPKTTIHINRLIIRK